MKTLTSLTFVIIILLHWSTLCYSNEESDNQDGDDNLDGDFFGDAERTEDWEDFNDMLNFDPVASKKKKPSLQERLKETGQKMKNKVKDMANKVKNVVCPTCTCTEYKANISVARNQLDECRREKRKLISKLTLFEGENNSGQSDSSMESTYMKRYVKFILELLPEQVPQDDYYEYDMKLEMSHENMAALKRFSEEEKGIQDALAALEGIVKDVQLVTEPYQDPKILWVKENITFWNVMHFITILLLTKIAMSMPLQMRFGYTWLQLTVRILIFMYLVSIPWNWWHLYQVEVAKRHADMLKDVPVECQSESQGIIASFFSAFSFSRDKCAEYHEKLLVDPMWEVSPTRAVAVTTSKFVLEPLEHLGHGISKFIKATVSDLPLHLQPFVFGLCVLLIVIMIIMFFGYNIRVFHFFGLENAGAGVVGQAQNRLQLQEANDRADQSREELLHLKLEKKEVELENRKLKSEIAGLNSDMDLLMGRMANLQITDKPHVGIRGTSAPAIAPAPPIIQQTNIPQQTLVDEEQTEPGREASEITEQAPQVENLGSVSTGRSEASVVCGQDDDLSPQEHVDDQLPSDNEDEDIYNANLPPDDPNVTRSGPISVDEEAIIDPRHAPAVLDLTEVTDRNIARSTSINETELTVIPNVEALDLVESPEVTLREDATRDLDSPRAQSESLAMTSFDVLSSVGSGLPANFNAPVDDDNATGTMTGFSFEEIGPEVAQPREVENHPGVSLPPSVIDARKVSKPMQESSASTVSQPSLKTGQVVSSYRSDDGGNEGHDEGGDGQDRPIEELGAAARPITAASSGLSNIDFLNNQNEGGMAMAESWQHVDRGEGDYTPSTDSDIEVIDESFKSTDERN